MRGAYEYRRRRLKARAGKIEDDGYEDRSVAYQTIVREVLEAQRAEIVRLRNEGTISNELMHRLERELDLEDERLEIFHYNQNAVPDHGRRRTPTIEADPRSGSTTRG